jgi:hypothetical protein
MATGRAMALIPLTAAVVVEAIDAGAPVMVAYDRDKNTHLPCARRGESSHWAMIRGYAKLAGGEVCVLVAHTMSARPFACTLGELLASNAQITAAKGAPPTGRWVIPEAGPNLAGLCVVPALVRST